MSALERIKAVFLAVRKAAVAPMSSVNTSHIAGGWYPIIREGFAGAWQRNVTCSQESVLAFAAVYRCVTLIASDIGKLRIKLVEKVGDIWEETQNPAFSPVLRKPNHYQTRNQFMETWMVSKLIHGNTYVLKQRDQRGIVTSLYVLDPSRVRPMVAPNGDVYYGIGRDDLSRVPFDLKDINAVPASEIIHDVMVPLYHPLCGVSPISACGLAAIHGLRVQSNQSEFFGNGSTPSGILTTPNPINEEQAKQYQQQWTDNYAGPANVGKVAVLGGGLTYLPMTMTAVDAQLVEQLKWTAENVCTAFGVPAYKVGVAPPPAYNNIEALNVEYYSQTLQSPIEHIEALLDYGLGLDGRTMGTELDLDGLLRMDTAAQIKAAADAVGAGIDSPNEARAKFDRRPVTGGESPYLQQQNYSLEALSKRDAQTDPFASKAPAATPQPSDDDEPDADEARDAVVMYRRSLRLAA